MQLFTVEMTTKSIVSRYDDKGRKIDEIETLIPVTFRDLPLQTAQMYREKNPDGNVRITAQTGVMDSGRARPGQYASRSRHDYEQKTTKSAKPSPKPSVQSAAQTGDLSAALNVGAK